MVAVSRNRSRKNVIASQPASKDLAEMHSIPNFSQTEKLLALNSGRLPSLLDSFFSDCDGRSTLT